MNPRLPVDMSPEAIDGRFQALGSLYALGVSLRGARSIGRIESLPREARGGRIRSERVWIRTSPGAPSDRVRVLVLERGPVVVAGESGTFTFPDETAAGRDLESRGYRLTDASERAGEPAEFEPPALG